MKSANSVGRMRDNLGTFLAYHMSQMVDGYVEEPTLFQFKGDASFV